MIVWGNANMELLVLIWSMIITVPVSLDTQVATAIQILMTVQVTPVQMVVNVQIK
jgi:hypothetical protein